MNNKIIFILISSFFLISCGEKSNKKSVTESTAEIKVESPVDIEKIEMESKIPVVEKELLKACTCYNGIGSSEKDEPILTFDFSNSKSASICGYKNPDSKTDQLLISEFNVFDCSDGKPLVEYGAMENCLIKTEKDLIKIELLAYLPVGEDWEWQSVSVAEQRITPDLNGLNVSEIIASYSPTQTSERQQSDFLESLQKGQGFGANWEEDIGKLEVLSLNGNEKAWGILKNYEEFTGEKTDGALAEMWKDAVAEVKRLTDKK